MDAVFRTNQLVQVKGGEMLKFYCQLLDMCKHLSDDVLPDLMIHFNPADVENMITKCEDVSISLKVFVKWCSKVQNNSSLTSYLKTEPKPTPRHHNHLNDKHDDNESTFNEYERQQNHRSIKHDKPASGSRGDSRNRGSAESQKRVFSPVDTTHQKPNDDIDGGKEFNSSFTLKSDGGWRTLFSEVSSHFDVMEEVNNFYYCGFCDTRCTHESAWEDHCQGKKHASKCEKALAHDCFGIDFSCSICGLNIFSDDEHITVISHSAEHQRLDDRISNHVPKKTRSLTKKGDSTAAGQSQKIGHPNLEPFAANTTTYSKKPVLGSNAHSPAPSEAVNCSESEKLTVLFKGKEIYKTFVEVTEVICGYIENRESFTCLFCRPCLTFCYSKFDWDNHCLVQSHVEKTKVTTIDTVLCLCLQCSFGLMAKRVLAIRYMNYHIEICHKQPTDDIKIEDYMEMREVDRPKTKIRTRGKRGGGGENCEIPSDRNSFKGSQNSVSSLKSQSAMETPQNDNFSSGSRPGSVASFDVSKNSIPGREAADGRPMSQCSLVSETSQHESVSTNDPISLFSALTQQKQLKFKKDPTFKPFSALCLLCVDKQFSSNFEWFDHIMTHVSSDEQNEVECPDCNTSIFGSVEFIRHELFSSKEHSTLDKLLTSI